MGRGCTCCMFGMRSGVCVRRSCIFDLVYIFVCDFSFWRKQKEGNKANPLFFKKNLFFYWKV